MTDSLRFKAGMLWRQRHEHRRVAQSLEHLHGPRRFRLAEDEAVGVILGRDVAFHLEELVRHHRALGVERFVYVDNGSTDGSVDLAASLGDVIVARTDAPFRELQSVIRQMSATRFATGGWRLMIDADELFDYPGSDRLPLSALLRDLNGQGRTAVVGHMLDMVPEDRLVADLDRSFPAAIAACRWYDLAHIEASDYHDPADPLHAFLSLNRVADPAIRLYRNGIRGALFGETCLLSKHPLVRPGLQTVTALHPHVSTGVSCADFTVLLRHYKFTGGFLAREQARVAARALSHGEAAQRMQRFEAEPELSFRLPTRRCDPTPERLLDEGFLYASADARARLGLAPSAG